MNRCSAARAGFVAGSVAGSREPPQGSPAQVCSERRLSLRGGWIERREQCPAPAKAAAAELWLIPQLRTPEPGSDNTQADGSVLLEAAPTPEQEADVAGSQRLLLGSINKTAAAAQTAMNEISAPLTR